MPERRADDQRLGVILALFEETRADGKQTRKDVSDLRELYSGWHGDISRRMTSEEEETKRHSDEIKQLREVEVAQIKKTLEIHAAFMNNTIGQKAIIKAGSSMFFAAVGATIMWLAQTFLAPLITKGKTP